MTALLEADEPPPFTIVNPQGRGAWVITCDHAGNRIPRALGTLGVSEAERARHIGWDIGAAAVARGLAERLDAWTILQTYSRLVIDCNRRPGVPSSIPLRSENTDIPGNAAISAEAATSRCAAIFDPYHAAITQHLDARQQEGRPTLLLAMHSFTPVYDGTARAMHVGVLYNRHPALSHALLALLRLEPGLIVGDNAPYQVSDETDYGIPVHGEARELPHIELEVRQDLIADTAGQAWWVELLARVLPKAGKQAVLF